ncbi:MAG: hypothetical protein LC808_36975, partial [Actinobacteria bacterium]|nr:hypothetical protein [Actinomycetota bacterium]
APAINSTTSAGRPAKGPGLPVLTGTTLFRDGATDWPWAFSPVTGRQPAIGSQRETGSQSPLSVTTLDTVGRRAD